MNIPKTIDAILDELMMRGRLAGSIEYSGGLTRVSTGDDREAQHAVERVCDRPAHARPERRNAA